MHVAALGIGYGNKTQVHGYAFLPPRSISDVRRSLKRAGFALRDVFGFIPYHSNDPERVVMMEHPPEQTQHDSKVKKGDLGKITPPGGKVEGRYLAMADAGFGSDELAYVADGLIREVDEIGCPQKVALKLLNLIQGLPNKNTFTSPNGKDLYVDGNFVRRYEYAKGTKPVQLLPLTERATDYEPLLDITISYSVGLNKIDRTYGKDLKCIATCVANVWIPITETELNTLAAYVKKNRPDHIRGLISVDIHDFGMKAYPTAVSNLIAMGLYTSPENQTALTGQPKGPSFPSRHEIIAYSIAKKHKTLDQVINAFREDKQKP